MIGDHHWYTELVGTLDTAQAGDAVVHGDDEIGRHPRSHVDDLR